MIGTLKAICPACKCDKIRIIKSFDVANVDWHYTVICADCGTHEYTHDQLRYKAIE